MIGAREGERRPEFGVADGGPAGAPTTPEETLDLGFFDEAALPRPFVPIHEIRVADALAHAAQTMVR